MKLLLLTLSLFVVCGVSAQQRDTITFEGGFIGNYTTSQTLPFLITTTPARLHTTAPKRTASGWITHEQFRIKAYPVTHGKVLGWAMAAFSGAVDGVVSGYEFDGRKSFERKYGVEPLSFWGSESWKRAYPNNNPEQRQIPLWRIVGAPDFYHVADDARKVGYIGSGITIGISGAKSNSRWWHYAADFAVGLAVSGAAKAGGMYWIRN